MKLVYSLVAVLFVLLPPRTTLAQCDPILAHDSLQWHTNGEIKDMATLGNTLYITGTFSAIGRYSGGFIGIDTGTHKMVNHATWPKVDGIVYKVISDNAGGWIIGGHFNYVGDSARRNIARINASGVVTPFNPGTDSIVRDMALVGNSLYVCGFFLRAGGLTRNRLAKFNLLTGATYSWNPNADNYLYALTVYNNNVYVGGYFTNVGGQPRKSIAALDTSSGNATSWNAKLATSTLHLNVMEIVGYGGKIYISGTFDSVGGIRRKNIARVDGVTATADGWNPAGSTIGTSSANVISPNGATVYLGGDFGSMGAATRNCFAEVDTITGTATGFNPLATTAITQINDILKVGNKLYLAVVDTYLVFVSYRNIGVIDIATSSFSFFRYLNDGDVYTLGFTGGVLYAGGMYSLMECKPNRNLAAIDMTGDTLTSWYPGFMTDIECLAVSPTRVYLGGRVSAATTSTTTSTGVVATDPITGAIDTAFATGVAGGPVRKMLYDAGNLYIGGDFYSIDLVSRDGLAKLSATTGMLDPVWNPGHLFIISINALDKYGPNIIIGGQFPWVGGQPRNNLAAVDKNTGLATSWDPWVNNAVDDLAVVNDKLLVGGVFDSISHIYVPKLARINLATNAVEAWAPRPNNTVKLAKPYYNSAFVYGYFSNIGTTAIPSMGEVNDMSVTPRAWSPNPDFNTINDMLVHEDRLYVAGFHKRISGQRNYPYLVQYKIRRIPDTVSISGGPVTLCAGATSSFLAGGLSGSTYQWRVNGIAAGSSASSFSYVPAHGDVVQCITTAPAGPCYTSDSAASNSIVITVNTPVVPTITLSTVASAAVGTTVTVNAAVAGAGSTYQVYWYLNGIAAGMTTTPVFTFTKGTGTENVYAVIKPSGCYDTALAALIYVDEYIPVIDHTGVTLIAPHTGVSVYPNPFTDNLSVKGLKGNERICIFDNNGRKQKEINVVSTQQASEKIDLAFLPAGVYYICVWDGNGQLQIGLPVQKTDK